MKNIIDYAEQQLHTFLEEPFNPVDSLVLSQFAYVHFNDVVPKAGEGRPDILLKDLFRAENFNTMYHNVRDIESNRRFLTALSASPRFRNIRMNDYADQFDPEKEEQFSAVTYFLEDGSCYVAFRGTDSTFVGWKEDFNMAFVSPVPSQMSAVRYLNNAARRSNQGIRVGGHSKGGNLAVYAATYCRTDVQAAILDIYSHDGPGFKEDIFSTPDYLAVQGRVHKTLPQSSIVGMLLQNQEKYQVVQSNRFGIMQHDPFSWSVEERDFTYVSQITSGAAYMNKTLNSWLASLSDEEREQFVDILYRIISDAGIGSLRELSEESGKKMAAILQATKEVDSESRKYLLQTVKALAVASLKNL